MSITSTASAQKADTTASATDVPSILDGIGSLVDTWEIRIPQVGVMRGTAHFSFSTQVWSVRDMAGGYDYHLVAVFGTLAFPLTPTLYLDWYRITTAPKSPDTILITSGPPTTQGNVSTETSVSKTLSSSVGFSGEDPNASIGVSVSTTNSQTENFSTIVCMNLSQGGSSENGQWNYGVAESSPSQGANFQFYNQMLYKVPQTGAAPSFEVSTSLSLSFSDHYVGAGTSYFDAFSDALRPNLPPINARQINLNDRIAQLNFPGHITHIGPAMPLVGAVLRQDGWLTTWDYLQAADNGSYCIMQADGNLCTYVGVPTAQGNLIWDSGVTHSGPDFFLTVEGNGNLAIYAVSGPPQAGAALVWQSGVTDATGDYFAILSGGFLAVYHGTPEAPGQILWSGPQGAPVIVPPR
jgi:hypothetical protein